MGEQRTEDPFATAVQRRLQCEVLVGGDVCDEPLVQGVERGHLDRLDRACRDVGRDLDHRVVGEKWQRAAVAQVHDMAVLGGCPEQAREQLDGRLRVEGTTAA